MQASVQSFVQRHRKSFDRSEYQLQIVGISYENSTEYLCLSQVLENILELSYISQPRLILILVLILKWDVWNEDFRQIAPRSTQTC